jgi:hypothetical protein
MLLKELREYVYFDEVRKRKAWNYNPLVSSVLYFASTQENIHQMMGNEVLGEKYSHSMLFDFSWLIALQRAWGVFVLTCGNISYPPKCIFQIGSCMQQERNVISVEPWRGVEGNWRDEPSSDQKILPVTGTKVAGVYRGRVLSGNAYTVWPIRKDLVVMSQWAHITRDCEFP